jgi:hypothetical protein
LGIPMSLPTILFKLFKVLHDPALFVWPLPAL